MKLIDRFIQYVQIDTQSNAESLTAPSTMKQWDLLHVLQQELQGLGLEKIILDPKGILYAFLPGNHPSTSPTIGLMAHVDTASEMSGKNVKPQVIQNYHGGKITLNEKLNIFLDPRVFPSLKNHRHKTLITTDGTTLLGADDKAGVAIIMTLLDTLIHDPSIHHGPLYVAFTTDEEIGRGVDHISLKNFPVDFAYTLDGGPIHEMNYENFNAASAVVTISGKAIHPGSAKNQMVNSQTLSSVFHLGIPKKLLPENTDNYQGFIHLTHSQGTVERSELHYILRDHDAGKLKQQIQWFKDRVKTLNHQYGHPYFSLAIKHTYQNMRPLIEKKPESLKRALQAYRQLKIPVKAVPIRGGTDGAMLTFKGIPTPNLATGGENYHGKYEYLVLEDAEKMVAILTEIIRSKM